MNNKDIMQVYFGGTSLATNKAEKQMARHDGERAIEAIYREGDRHYTAQLVQHVKVVKARELIQEIHTRRVELADDFRREVFARAAQETGNTDSDEWFDQFVVGSVEMYGRHSMGLAEAGVRSIAELAYLTTLVEVEKPRGWRTRLGIR
jgi:hypothetical protein